MKHIDFVTLGRSDYTTLRPVALAAKKDPAIEMRLIAGGSHILKRFGNTIDDISQDGLPVSHLVDFLKEEDDSDTDMAGAYARAVSGFVDLFRRKPQPECVFIVGDRWEMLAVASAASMLRIPIAHHSGGDITQGSADNQTRYALTILSHLHFVALEDHARRLARMGEEKWRITVTGEPALESLSSAAKETDDLYTFLGIAPCVPFVLATFHPTSYDDRPLLAQIEIFIETLDMIKDAIVLTAPNPDPGSRFFFDMLSNYAARRENIRFVENLGSSRYYAAMSRACLMIGNSSSGLWEAPSFGLPVVNIGRRQDGRVRGKNVIDTGLHLEEIRSAVAKALSPAFRDSLKGEANPYVKEGGVEKILSTLKQSKDTSRLLAKIFMDPLGSSDANQLD